MLLTFLPKDRFQVAGLGLTQLFGCSKKRRPSFGFGSKRKPLGTTCFGLLFHLPIGFFGYPFLTHSHFFDCLFFKTIHPTISFFNTSLQSLSALSHLIQLLVPLFQGNLPKKCALRAQCRRFWGAKGCVSWGSLDLCFFWGDVKKLRTPKNIFF